MVFWMICAALALVVIAVMVLAVLRADRQAAQAPSDETSVDIKVYRDQLAEVDRDVARGILGAEDAERVRTEISRRLLAADKAARKGGAPLNRRASSAAKIVALGLSSLVLLGGSLWLYRGLGAPGYGDLPLQLRIAMAEENRANRPDQAAAEASLPAPVADPSVPGDYKALVAQLRDAVAQRPDDLQGARLLARHEMALGRASAAADAQKRVIDLLGAKAQAEDHARLADMLVIAAGGYVSPEAEASLRSALRLDPSNGVARYYAGLMAVQIGRPDVGFRHWAPLLRDSKVGDPWLEPVRAQIEDLAFRAGVKYELPPLPEAGAEGNAPLAGPSREDVQAASEMSTQERQEMIAGMVARLSDRLATEGGTPEEFARLMSALVVLERGDEALLIYRDAQQAFAEAPEALETINAAARRLGMPE